jgi:hypothetical protein
VLGLNMYTVNGAKLELVRRLNVYISLLILINVGKLY